MEEGEERVGDSEQTRNEWGKSVMLRWLVSLVLGKGEKRRGRRRELSETEENTGSQEYEEDMKWELRVGGRDEKKLEKI